MLPNPPEITYNITTGQVNFSSPMIEGIQLDFYQIIVTDVTNQAVVNNTVPIGNSISVGDLFLQQTCVPYILTVQAHNTYGFTDDNVTIVGKNGTNGGKVYLFNCITVFFH